MNKLLTKRETAALLRISINTLNFWISRQKIPFLKLGKSKNSPVRFSERELSDWLKNTKGKKLRNYEG